MTVSDTGAGSHLRFRRSRSSPPPVVASRARRNPFAWRSLHAAVLSLVLLALAAYNARPTAVERAGTAPTLGSLRYAKNVEARAALLSGC